MNKQQHATTPAALTSNRVQVSPSETAPAVKFPFVTRAVRRALRTASLPDRCSLPNLLVANLLLGTTLGIAATFTATPAVAETISSPADARTVGLDSLRRATQRDGGVPLPKDLSTYVKNRAAAIQLGKAFFWDMQVGSDGVQACASCHFHAGTDDRTRNALNPAESVLDQRIDDVLGYVIAPFDEQQIFELAPPNGTVKRSDFPLVKNIQSLIRTPEGRIQPAPPNTNDTVGSMGVFFTQFDGVTPGASADSGTPIADPLFNINGNNLRRVEHRNTPTVINAIFNYTNFWDGRANPHFNGRDNLGDQNLALTIFVNDPVTGLTSQRISIDTSSLASQALAPTISPVEMSFNGRRGREIGVRLLRPAADTGRTVVPLGKQRVHLLDSVLAPLANRSGPGLNTSYAELIKRAFADQYWNAPQTVTLPGTPVTTDFTQMEANFSLFFGLAVQLYESTLVADRTPFDQWMETGRLNFGFGKRELAGLNLFVNQGNCISCHTGPELTSASVRSVKNGAQAIEGRQVATGTALTDRGFFNISVTPTTDDIGRGSLDPFGEPLAFSRQALLAQLGIITLDFSVIGGNTIPATDRDRGRPVCDDLDHDGFCSPDEPFRPEFQRGAVDGAFKVPGLRNTELTGPYFHNGGMATLRQVVQFYNRGGNFCKFNQADLAAPIKPLGLSAEQEEDLVAFLVSLTDPRVRFQQAPFDHPEIRIPVDGFDTMGTRTIPAVGLLGSLPALRPFLDLNPNDAIFTPQGVCSKDAPDAK